MPNLRITLLLPLSLEEKVSDYFLCDPSIGVFTSSVVSVHGLSNSMLNSAEQVMGSAKETEIVVVVDEERFELWISEFERLFTSSGIRYWSTPIYRSGVLV